MKIAFLGTGIISGGLIAVLRDILNYTADGNIMVKLFCEPGFISQFPRISSDIEVVETIYARESKFFKVFGLSFRKQFISLIEEYSPDAIFYLTGSLKKGLEKYESYFVLNNPLYTDYYKIIKQKNLKLCCYMTYLAWINRKAMTKVDHIIFSSYFSKCETEKVISIKDSRVIPFACNSIFFDHVHLNKKPINPKDFAILCIGSIIPYKNQLSVIEAVRILDTKGYGVRLLIVGPVISNEYYKKCYRKIKRYGITSQVEHIPWIPFDEIPGLIDDCDIYVNASETDTCGTAAEEGMARGAVVIANDVGFNREMAGDEGIYFDVKNPASLAEAIETVIHDKKMQEKAREAAFFRARQRTLSDTAKDYYEYILQKNNEVVI